MVATVNREAVRNSRRRKRRRLNRRCRKEGSNREEEAVDIGGEEGSSRSNKE